MTFYCYYKGGKIFCYYNGKETAVITKSLFPDHKELDGYDVVFRRELREATAGRLGRMVSLFETEQDAIDHVRHACIVGFIRPTGEPQQGTSDDADRPKSESRPISRPRDEHINV